LVQRIPTTIHHGLFNDETGQLSTWHVPGTHYLETWGDVQASNGVTSIQQPLIAPLYDGISEIELLSQIIGDLPTKGHQLVKGFWLQVKGKLGFEANWRKWLHDGVIAKSAFKVTSPKTQWNKLAEQLVGGLNKKVAKAFDLHFTVDSSVADGRYSNNAWLMEAPDPITKLCWDNAALVSPKTARENNLSDGDFIEITLNKSKLDIPVFKVPGIAADSIVLPLGYGRKFGSRVADKAGFNAYLLRSSEEPYFAVGATIKKLRKHRYPLSTTQEHGRLEPPQHLVKDKRYHRTGIYRQFHFDAVKGKSKKDMDKAIKADVDSYELMPESRLRSLWDRKDKKKDIWSAPQETHGQQWGMTIDLNTCVGCNACLVACQSENNIPIVGKERMGYGRELHWIRMDRYFTGSEEEGTLSAVLQPLACVHCETAPCENVCPVAATTHSPSGLNDMAYNRCIGTRYCSNNCPYKVRRFNFFNYTKETDATFPTHQMQRNPDVTVRFRGVMEKCTYCVQRINEETIKAKAEGNGLIKDGAIKMACEQACPTKSIVFGDITDKNSRVYKAKNDPRNYGVLSELNTKPRTTYLARLRNPNAKLVKIQPLKSKHHGHGDHGHGHGKGHGKGHGHDKAHGKKHDKKHDKAKAHGKKKDKKHGAKH